MKGHRGYVFSRAMGGSFIPQRVQNLVLREYAKASGLDYLLAAVEYEMPGCWMVLNGLLEERNQIDGLIFYSSHQLPEKRPDRDFLYSTIGANFNLHLALEQLVFDTPESCLLLEDLIMGRTLAGVPDFGEEEDG
ncbi:MAG: hypothetical protein H6510_00935 [Acidobacteria bacterium]|nr:hypothetical protein [Acidobacteriota bacterium]MCB9396353.1 hypothetical protein [Acidobacteriota bacterium]